MQRNRRCRSITVRNRERVIKPQMLDELTLAELEALGLMKPWLQDEILSEAESRVAETAALAEEIKKRAVKSITESIAEIEEEMTRRNDQSHDG